MLLFFDKCWDKNADGHPYNKAIGDSNIYTTGLVGYHNVVFIYLGGIGNVSAAGAAASVRINFPNIKFGFVVGVLYVIPSGFIKNERVLGDIIINEAIV